jgi:hypothetical protein
MKPSVFIEISKPYFFIKTVKTYGFVFIETAKP